ncbi:MAG: Gfo/Idh/MocA family protein [Planctomycetota bacterium]|jgi:predicted dehydrogenase
MKRKPLQSRRDFLKAGSTLFGAACLAPTIVPSSVFGANAPSNRINVSLVGMGLISDGHFRNMLSRKDVFVHSVCDVDRNRLDKAVKQANDNYGQKSAGGAFNGTKGYHEYEEICGNPDIDAVMVLTPDHWHAMISLAAIKNGKDVYCQKPMTLTIAEGRLLSDACKQYGAIFQVGSQQRSESAFRKAAEIVRNGWIGEIETVYAKLGSFAPPTSLEEQPVPTHLDYDRWLGPTPYYPYNAERVKGNYGGGWRRFWEYGSRKNGDWGAHHYDIIQWALGMDDSGPVKFVPKGFDGHEYQTHYYANGTKVLRDHPTTDGQMIEFIGTKGRVQVSRGGRLGTTPSKLKANVISHDGIHLYHSNGHEQNWLDCIRSRKQPICTAEIGHRTATICHLSGIAERLGRTIHWDPEKEKILNDAAAARWFDRPRRAPYVL